MHAHALVSHLTTSTCFLASQVLPTPMQSSSSFSAGHMEKICQVTMKVSECSTQIMMNHRSVDHEIRGGPLLCVTHQVGEGALSTESFDKESGECALKQVAAQGKRYLAVVMVMYTVVASLLEGMLPGPLEIGYHSSEPHVMAHNVIASLVLKLHEEKYIKFDDLAPLPRRPRLARRPMT